VLLGRGRSVSQLLLATLLVLLAAGVWYTTIREPPPLP
jgi:hypothetical protein